MCLKFRRDRKKIKTKSFYFNLNVRVVLTLILGDSKAGSNRCDQAAFFSLYGSRNGTAVYLSDQIKVALYAY